MRKRKINLSDVTSQDAFAVLEREGLDVRVVGLLDRKDPPIPLDSIIETAPQPVKHVKQEVGPPTKRLVRVTLYAAHSVGCGGVLVDEGKKTQRVENVGVETYGPGVCTVPAHLAQHLLHADALARKADDRTFDRKFRSYVVGNVQNGSQSVDVGFLVDDGDNPGFDMSSYLGSIGNNMANYNSPVLFKIRGQ